MALGRVNWFGGLNKKTGQVNNFGFLDSINDAHQSGIYVSKRNVPSHIQPLLEPGTYVEFDIREDERGEKYADNVEMVLLVGTIDWFENGRGYVKCDGYDDIRVESLEDFQPSSILSFYIRYNSRFNKNEAFLPRKVDYSTKDKAVIELCAKSSQSVMCVPFIAGYANLLSEDAAIKFTTGKIDALDVENQQSLLCNLFQQSAQIILASAGLRRRIITDRSSSGYNSHSSSTYWQFIDKYIHSPDGIINQELIAEVRDKLSIGDEEIRSTYWNLSEFLKSSLEYRGNLWEFAPVEVKIDLIRQRYYQFFDLVSKFEGSSYLFSESISYNWQKLYELDDVDNELTELWCSSPNKSSEEKARMISARGAEKLAIKFFRDMGHEVEDIAAHQATQQSTIWRKADIQIDSHHLLDVKNARKALNSSVYSEFCVPKFKENRTQEGHSKDIFIVAVLSPYLQSRYLTDNFSHAPLVRNPCILGVSSVEQIESLEKHFSDKAGTLSINLRRRSDLKQYLPPWLFDYSIRFYSKQSEAISAFSQLKKSDIPDWQDICLTGDMSLSLFISARRPIPESWEDNIPAWKTDFIRLLFGDQIRSKRISLPHLFLALLKHFLKMLSEENPSYRPKQYASLLYSSIDSEHPLKLYDPLNLIKDFCETLQCLWGNREETKLHRFKMFKFTGKGMLQGKQSNSDPNWTTLLAYCGGYVEGKGKCGYTPLVIGQHHNCTKCGHLICPKEDCQCCSRYCSEHEKRLHSHPE